MINYNPITKTFNVFTSDTSKIGTIQIMISGKLGIYNTLEYTFNLHIVCYVNTFT